MNKATRHITKGASIITISIGILVLAGWFFNIPLLKSVLPGIVEMKFNTALCFILSGIALFLLDKPELTGTKKSLALICSWLVLILGLLNLSQYLFGWNLGIDELLWTEGPGTVATSSPGRMSLSTAVNFTLIGLVFLLLQKRKTHWFIQAVFAFIITGSLLVVLNHIFGTSVFNNIPQLSNTALPTALLFMVLGIAVVYSEPLRYLKFSYEKKITGFFILTALVLAFTFYAIAENDNYTLDTVKRVELTNEILLLNQRILNLAQDIETGTRGFIISGKENFLEPYDKALPVIHSSVAQLKQLTKDNPKPQQHIDSLDKLVSSNIDIRKQLIELRRTKGFEAANVLFETGITKKLMDQLRAVIADIDRIENQLLLKRKADNGQSIANSSKVITLFQVIAVLLMILMFVVIYNNTRARNKAEAEIKKLNETLERRVQEKTKEVIEKEKQYRFLLENMREGIQVIGHDWRYLFVNSSVVEQSKYSNKELLGHTMMEKYPGIENTELFKVLQQCMKERTAKVFENEFTFPDGKKEWFELSIQQVPEGIFILSMDITERKKAEEAIIASEETRRLIMNSAQDAIVCIDSNSLITVWTPQAEKVFGWNEQEALGKNLTSMIIPPQYRERHSNGMKHYLHTGEGPVLNKLIEITAVNKEGTEFPVELRIVPFYQNGRKFFCGFIRDITERKKAEDSILILNKSLEKRAAELLSSNTELERFAYVASHDLQEPLRMVSSFLHLLEKNLHEKLDEVNKKYMDFAVDGAERMKKLIQDLLAYSRLGKSKETVTNVDCNEVVETISKFYSLSIQETNARLQVNPLPVIKGVQSQIQQLFQNLIGNALKYKNNEAPEIEVGYHDQNDEWQFYVKDNGIGIDPKYFDKIFIIFQRLHNNKEFSGTGIGLSICKKIVVRHGGRIWVESEVGKGSTFYFTIPKNKS